MSELRIPSFDEVVVQILGFLGLSGTIIALVAGAFAVQSWYDGAKWTIALTRKAKRGLGNASTAVMSMTPIRGVASVLITVAVPVAQLLTVGLCFLGGNYISMIFHVERWQKAVEVVKDDPEHLYSPEHLSQFLTLDVFSAAYVLLAFVVLLWSYRLARGPTDDLSSAGLLLAWPAVILLFFAGAALVICLCLLALMLLLELVVTDSGFSDTLTEGFTTILPLLIGGSICLAYYLACQAAVHGSRLVVRAWARDTY